MARYPTYEEYAKNGKFKEGIARCDQLLSKNPKDVSLLVTKLQLLCTSQPSSPEGPRILDQLVATQPAIQDLNELVSIEIAVTDTFKNTYPQPLSAGPTIAKLWENAFKANTNVTYRSELLTVRYQRAIYDNRIQDVQQTLIQLKQFQPKNRAIYMAHAAYTQLLSKSKDDLQSKLALGLARKAVSEKFDADPKLDCRVAGQIFAVQGSEKDLESIRDRQAFRESKQVYEALQLHRQSTDASAQKPAAPDAEKQSSREWLEATSESLKSQLEKIVDEDAAASVLNAFVVDAIRLLHTATAKLDLGHRKRSAADPCFLAVSGLVRLYADTNDQTHLLQSIFLTEQLLTFEPHVHEARLILVYLYMRLGLGTEAMRLFDSLSIKEVQFDTVGHTLFTRISTTHPFRTQLPSGDYFEPHERTNKALQVPPRHENKLFETEAAVLEHNQTGMIFELNGLREEIRHSLMRRVTLLEHRRTARLSGKGYGKSTSEIGPRVLDAWTNLKDNRDFNAAFDFGYSVEKALYATSSGSIEAFPKQAWLLYNLAADQAWSLASKQIPLLLEMDTSKLIEAVCTSLESQSELTPAETLSAYLILSILPVLATLKSGDPQPPSSDALNDISTQLKRLDIESLCSTPSPLAQGLQAHYTYLDTLLILLQTCKLAAETPSLFTDEFKAIRDATMKGVRDLQEHATEVSVSIGGKSNVGFAELISGGDDEVQKVVVELFGKEKLDVLASKLRESAREGWMGVGKVVLPGTGRS
ncbi:hypothetical protein CKM354_001235700 [Cercospora kikuchii]|uniref:Uncharacterized protein n=1 Tax=Cercospora kikuchii TaxID=84275 RepID=A0A9P3FLU1_9PEZI|nr:uncharacterized protein CKM354_001235700 [Cercospora kikuchii]GIZ49325.1 hypothetical protein CKM354_001235700 [Cercospora kikuchii]